MKQLLNFSSIATCYGDGKANNPFRYGDDAALQFSVGRYNHALLACLALQALASAAQLLAIACKYIRAEPALLGAQVWWSFRGSGDAAQQPEAGQDLHYSAIVFATMEQGRKG